MNKIVYILRCFIPVLGYSWLRCLAPWSTILALDSNKILPTLVCNLVFNIRNQVFQKLFSKVGWPNSAVKLNSSYVEMYTKSIYFRILLYLNAAEAFLSVLQRSLSLVITYAFSCNSAATQQCTNRIRPRCDVFSSRSRSRSLLCAG